MADHMITQLNDVQSHLTPYQRLSRPIRIAKQTLEAIKNENKETSSTQYTSNLALCRGEVEGLCEDIKVKRDFKDTPREGIEKDLSRDLVHLIDAIIKLAGAGATSQDVAMYLQQLHGIKSSFSETGNVFTQHGGAQNNNTGDGKQVNNNITGQNGTQNTGDHQSIGKGQ